MKTATMKPAKYTEDIPTLVAEEIAAANQAGIPSSDQPSYVADRLRHRIAGSAEYTRKRAMSASQRHVEIRAKFNGRNVEELSREYDLTPRRVRQILSELKCQEIDG